jgi:hypothetical protein
MRQAGPQILIKLAVSLAEIGRCLRTDRHAQGLFAP